MTNREPSDDDEEIGQYASPACLMHEVDAAYMGLAAAPEPPERADNMGQREAERAGSIVAWCSRQRPNESEPCRQEEQRVRFVRSEYFTFRKCRRARMLVSSRRRLRIVLRKR